MLQRFCQVCGGRFAERGCQKSGGFNCREMLKLTKKKVRPMNYSGKGAFANKYFNFRTLLLIFVSIPTLVLAGLMSYVMYLVVINNINTLVSMITPNLLVVLMYGTLAVVAVVILILLIAIVKAGGRLYK